MSEGKTTLRDLVWPIFASVISFLVVGLVASYMTAHEMIARFDERLSVIERDIESARVEREAIRLSQAAALEGERRLSERLIRLETKIDILLVAGDRE